MRIAIILGGVLDPSGIAVNRRSGSLFVNRREYIIHPSDRCALEATLHLRDTLGAEVVALPRTAINADDVLRQALARGADRAILLAGAGFEDADDAVIVRVLAAALRRLGDTDLIVTGAGTLDSGWTQLAGRLAESLERPQVLRAWRIDVQEGVLRATCSLNGEYRDVICGLPAVVSVADGSMRLRYPDGTRLINVYRSKDAIQVWPVEELVTEDDLIPLLEQKGLDFPAERELGQRIRGPHQSVARTIVEHLRSRAFV